MIKRLLIVTGLFSLSLSTLKAQAPKYSNEFLSIGVGARGLGMSGAQVASVSDATAAFWNPAGLVGVKSNIQIALMHSEYFAGISKYDYGTIATAIDATTVISGTFIRLGTDDIPDTTELIGPNGEINWDRIKSFSAADYAFMFTYAKQHKTIENLRYGGSAKVIYRNVGEFAKAYGFGFDIGAQYDYGKFTFGALAKDVTSTFNAWNFNVAKLQTVFAQTNNEIPQNSVEITLPKLILGAAFKHNFTPKISSLVEADFDMTFDGKRNVLIKSNIASIDPHVGIELGYDNFIFLRAGVGNIQQIKDNVTGKPSTKAQPNIGVGLRLKRLAIDYALTNKIASADGVPYSNVISLKLDIFKNK